MNRTTAPNSAAGFYVDENPAEEKQGTLLWAEDRNALQEELIELIVAGGLTPNGGDLTQVRQAVQALVKDFGAIGCIMMFDGAGWVDNSTMPGWYACISENAGQGCPNMVNRFVMGKVVAGSGATGGSNDAIVVSHNHTFTGSALANHNHTFTGSSTTTGAGSSHNHVFTGSALATHGHTFTGSALGTHSHQTTEQSPLQDFGNWDTTVVRYSPASASGYRPLTQAVSAGTPAGTLNNVSAGTPAGTNAAEAAHTHTLTPLGANTAASGGTPAGTISTEGVSGTGANRPAYYSMIFIRKCA